MRTDSSWSKCRTDPDSVAIHEMPLEQTLLYGAFDNSRSPVLTIDAGDTVQFRTCDSSWGENAQYCGESYPVFERNPAIGTGHALSGPIFVRGAEPGDALEIEVVDIRPAVWGWTWTGPRPWNPRFNIGGDRDVMVGWRIDPDRGLASDLSKLGVTLAIKPFLGVMGNAPGQEGVLPTAPPRRVGGNIDCKELVAGSRLLLPVEVEGALFSTGDGHAVQGDGEVAQTAIECPMDRAELRFSLRKGVDLPGPCAWTPAGFVTMGFGVTLDEAAVMALDAMLNHVQSKRGLERPEAMILASLLVDLRVTQVVNGTMGVHAILAPDAFR